MEMEEGMTGVEFRRIYDTVFPVLFRIAFRIAGSEEAAEDMCQEAFFKLHEKNMAFPSMDEAKYWLIRVVKNASINYAKRKDRERKVYQKAFREERRTGAESGEDELLKEEAMTEVRAALAQLPENLRSVLVFKEYGGLNYKEIGKILGISEGNVKVRVFRARERMGVILAKEGGDYVS